MTELDLTPREVPGGRRRSLNWLVIGALVFAIGFVLFQAINSASVFYLNVDEALATQSELGDDTFRMQGTVVSEPITTESGAIEFDVAFNGVTTTVRHVGEEPSDLFAVGEAVIVEGHFVGSAFQSNQILVKHSESYVADNKDRDGVG